MWLFFVIKTKAALLILKELVKRPKLQDRFGAAYLSSSSGSEKTHFTKK